MKKKLFLSVLCSSILMLNGCANIPKQIEPSKTQVQQHNVLDEKKETQLATRFENHLTQLEKIAAQYGGNRAVGTKGGQATAAYIMEQVKNAGFTVQMIPFENRNKVVGQNIIVEIKGTDNNQATIIGAHYDSLPNGPGINDNGSGVAVLLELLNDFSGKKISPKNTIYLAFWDSEEEGAAGSKDFVSKMTPEQLKGIKAYINVDMVGTKDPKILIADADKSSLSEMKDQFKAAGLSEKDYQPLLDGLQNIPSHLGDIELEKNLQDFFKQKNRTIKEDISTLTASDTAYFLGKVPVASIILFNEQERPSDQQNEVILDFAPCYHQACDKADLIDINSMLLVYEAIHHLLKSTDSI